MSRVKSFCSPGVSPGPRGDLVETGGSLVFLGHGTDHDKWSRTGRVLILVFLIGEDQDEVAGFEGMLLAGFADHRTSSCHDIVEVLERVGVEGRVAARVNREDPEGKDRRSVTGRDRQLLLHILCAFHSEIDFLSLIQICYFHGNLHSDFTP